MDTSFTVVSVRSLPSCNRHDTTATWSASQAQLLKPLETTRCRRLGICDFGSAGMESQPARVQRFPQRYQLVGVVLGMLLVVAVNVLHEQSAMFRPKAGLHATLRQTRAMELFSSVASHVQSKPMPDSSPVHNRGIVLPLFDEIATIGMSLVLELRTMDVDLPIEISHCGDLDPKYQTLFAREDPLVRVYDACQEAAQVLNDQGQPRFCTSLAHCHEKFRSFDIKVISVLLSRFNEVMLMDADTLYFQSPMPLWHTHKYNSTGTLLFHDRICADIYYLAEMQPDTNPPVNKFQHFLAHFNVTPFQSLAVVPRSLAKAGAAAEARATKAPVQLSFEPSDFLLTSNAWNRRTGHEMDSSLMLWDKRRQERATAILASFISINGPGRPPGFGDKELFFTACELAETAYEYTDYGIGSIGPDKRTVPDRKTNKDELVVCGDGLQYFPESTKSIDNGAHYIPSEDSPLYLNGDNFIAKWNPNAQPIYRTKARPADYYGGSFGEHGIDANCPFNTTVLQLSPYEDHRMLQRQKMHAMIMEWLQRDAQQ